MLRRRPNMAEEGIRDAGQQLRLDPGGGTDEVCFYYLPHIFLLTCSQCHSPRRVSSRDSATEDRAAAT